MEAVAVACKQKAQDWIRKIEDEEKNSDDDEEWTDPMPYSPFMANMYKAEKIQETRELISSVDGKWKADSLTREQYKSVEEVHRQQVELVGGEEGLDRLIRNIATRQEDSIFLKEQLRLYRYRLDFSRSFFPYWAQRFSTIVQNDIHSFGSVVLNMKNRFGWWHLKGAGTHFVPEFALIALDFDKVVDAAFHMNGPVIYFGDSSENDKFLQDGFKFDRKFHMVFVKDDVEDEIHNLSKIGVSLYEQEVVDEICNSFEYVKRVVLALHENGPTSLKKLAARMVLLDMEDNDVKELHLPKTVVDFLEAGINPNPADISPRGEMVWEAVLREEQEEEELREEREEEGGAGESDNSDE